MGGAVTQEAWRLALTTCDEILRQIDQQWDDLLRVKSAFPTMNKELIGQRKINTAPFYKQHGYPVSISFPKPLTPEMIEALNQISMWLNESYVIRLCALLEYSKIIPQEGKSQIDQSIEGHEAVDILRRLRNKLLHRSGRYNPKDRESRLLYERIVNTFSLDAESPNEATRFPLPINTFLLPLTKKCNSYVVVWFAKYRTSP